MFLRALKRISTPLVASPAALAALTLTNCKTRTFSEPKNASAVRQASTSNLPSLAASLTDDPAFLRGEKPPRNVGANLIVLAGRSYFPIVSDSGTPDRSLNDFLTNMAFPGETATLKHFPANSNFNATVPSLIAQQNVVEFERTLSRKPVRFGGATILKVMLDNLKEFSRQGERGIIGTPNLLDLSATLKDFADKRLRDFENDPTASYWIADPRKPFSVTWCKTTAANYLSDLRYHYTCQIPAVFRACYREVVGLDFDLSTPSLIADFASGAKNETATLAALGAAAAKDHLRTVAFCSEGGDLSVIPAETLKAYNAPFADKSKQQALQTYRKAFSAFHASQKRTVAPGVDANIFDYIMTTGAFDLDYAQQQDVLNAFYGALSDNPSAFDPAKPADCSANREARPITDAFGGTHCLAATPKVTSMFSNGR